MGFRLGASNKQSPLLIRFPVDETCQPGLRPLPLPSPPAPAERDGARDGCCQTAGDTGERRGDGAEPPWAGGSCQTEPLLLPVAERHKPSGRAQNPGFVPNLPKHVDCGTGHRTYRSFDSIQTREIVPLGFFFLVFFFL